MRRRTVLCLAALTIGPAACGDGGGGDAASTTTTAAPTTSSTSTSGVPGTGEPATDAADTAEAWVDALAGGDLDAAWELVGPASREEIGGRDGFERDRTALAEGWAAFGRADVDVRVVGSAGGADLVVLRGVVQREGTTEDAAGVLPVREARVEPFVYAGNVELPTEIGDDGLFDVFALVGRDVVTFVDGAEADLVEQAGADGDQTRWTFRAPSADAEVVVAAATDQEGGITARGTVLGGGGA